MAETKNQKRRREYFLAKGMDAPPISSEERRVRAEQFLSDQSPPNFEAALMLFDPETDAQDSNWLLVMGWLHNQHLHGNPYFSAEKAFRLFVKSSQLGNGTASRNIGIGYFKGQDSEVDLDAATYWFRKAIDQGEISSNLHLAMISIDHDMRYYDPKEIFFSLPIHKQIDLAVEKGFIGAMDRYTKVMASGRVGEKFHDAAISVYKMIIVAQNSLLDPLSIQVKNVMTVRVMFRMYLRCGFDSNTSQILKLGESLQSAPNNTFTKYVLKPKMERLSSIMEADRLSPNMYQKIKTIVQHAYFENTIPDDIVTAGDANTIANILWCVNELAEGEEWIDRLQWRDLLRATQANVMRLILGDIVVSTLTEGPRYNPRASNGMPVLGVLEAPSVNESAIQKERQKTGSYVPMSGVVKFNGVSIGRKGEIIWSTTSDRYKPALLVEEDFDVALVLAFGSSADAVNPLLSLEDPNRHGIDDQNGIFKFKWWSPVWLHHTDLGRTLYMADQLIAALCWHPREFDIGTTEVTFAPEAAEFALALIDDIALTGGRIGDASHARVMLVPEHISIQTEFREEGCVAAYVEEVKMRIDGDYVIRGDKKVADLHLNKNDDLYMQGRTVNKLTRRYDHIATLMPIFERAKELMALLEATRALRRYMDRQNLKLHPRLIERLRRRYVEFEAMHSPPRHQLLCVTLPLELKRL